MRWLGDGDCTPIIFGWFAAAGGKIISWSQDDDAKSASIDGLTFWRCGPHPEHGIVIDNMSAFRFRGRVLVVQNSDGGDRKGDGSGKGWLGRVDLGGRCD